MKNARALLAAVASLATACAASAEAARSPAEQSFAKTVAPLSANDVTGNLVRNIGTHVSFVCTVTAIVHADTLIGQCGRSAEPVDMYVLVPTAGLRIGTRLRILGEMQTPSVWVDVTGHSWYTAMLKARYVDRI